MSDGPYESVWDALEKPGRASVMKAKSQLLMLIQTRLDESTQSTRELRKKAKLNKKEYSLLVNGQQKGRSAITEFSFERLGDIADGINLDIELELHLADDKREAESCVS